MIPYIQNGRAISHVDMNVLVSALRNIFTEMFFGLAPALAYKVTGFTINDGNKVYSGGIPAELLGLCFFFNDHGPTPLSRLFPGYVARTATVNGVDVEHARTYDHDPFIQAETSLAVLSWLDSEKVVTFETAGPEFYTEGMIKRTYPFPKVTGVSLFDHSLCAHGKMGIPFGATEPVKYYARENPCRHSARVNELAVAEIVIEGLESIELPTDSQYVGVVASAYECIRFWNMQPIECEVSNLGVTLPPFSCKCVRRVWNETAHEFSSPVVTDYFFDFNDRDIRGFTAFASEPFSNFSSLMIATAIWPGGAAQGNNTANLSVLLDWIRALSSSTPPPYARMILDPHEVCDLMLTHREETASRFACVNPDSGQIKDGAKLGDLFHVVGDLRVVAISETDPAPAPHQDKFLEEWDVIRFPGWHDFQAAVDAFAEKGIELVNDAGVLKLKNARPGYSIDLIHKSTNMLKNVEWGGGVNQTLWYAIRDGANIPVAGFAIETKVLENTLGLNQDAGGFSGFVLADSSSYKVLQKQLTSTARVTSYVNPFGQTVAVSGEPQIHLSEIPPVGANMTVTNIATFEIEDILNLKWIGNESRESQDDAHVSFTGKSLKFTPQGWVEIFTESVRADALPTQVAPVRLLTNQPLTLSGSQIVDNRQVVNGDRVAIGSVLGPIANEGVWIANTSGDWERAEDSIAEGSQVRVTDGQTNSGKRFRLNDVDRWVAIAQDDGTNGTSEMLNYFGRPMKFNPATGRFEVKHKVFLSRKHGFGFWQFARINSAAHSPFTGRLVASSWTRDVLASAGRDLGVPGKPTRTGIMIPRSIGELDLTAVPGGRIFGSVPTFPLDSLQALEKISRTPYAYQTREGAFLATPRERVQVAVEDGSGYSRLTAVGGNLHAYSPLSVIQYNMVAEAINSVKSVESIDWRCLRFVSGFNEFYMDPDEGDIQMWQDAFGAALPAPFSAYFVLNSSMSQDRIQAWRVMLHSLGLDEFSTFPDSLDANKAVANQNRTMRFVMNSTLSGQNGPVVRQVYRTGIVNPVPWSAWFGTVTSEASAFLDNPVNTTAGIAIVAIQGVSNVFNPVTINLNTAYAGRAWYRTQDVISFCAQFGIELKESSVFVPVALDVFQRSDDLKDADGENPSGQWSWNAELVSYAGNYLSQSAAALRAFITAEVLNTTIAPKTDSFTYAHRQVAFRLHGEDGEDEIPEWKLPVSVLAPSSVFMLNRRTEGMDPSLQVKFHYAASFSGNSASGQLSPPVTWGLSTGQQVGPGSTMNLYQLIYGYNATYPWTPDDLTVFWPNQSAPTLQDVGLFQLAASGSQQFPWPEQRGLTFRRGETEFGLFLQLAPPQDETRLRQAETWFRWLNQEQHWIAVEVIGIETFKAYKVPTPVWSAETDWWQASGDAYLQHILTGSNPVPRDVPATAPSQESCGEGVTLLKPDGEGRASIFFKAGKIETSIS